MLRERSDRVEPATVKLDIARYGTIYVLHSEAPTGEESQRPIADYEC